MAKPLYLAGEWQYSSTQKAIINPYTDETIEKVCLADEKIMDDAIQKAVLSFKKTKKLIPAERAKYLDNIIHTLKKRRDEFTEIITMEAGKPVQYARGEVDRAIMTFTLSRNAALETPGEYLDLAIQERARGYQSFVKRFPIGPIAAIAPFNFPLNLVAHKIGPAMATGCPIILKPSSKTPLTALLLAEVVEKSGWPKEAFSVLPSTREVGQKMVEDKRFKLLTFTGSPSVGWKIKKDAGNKKVLLELGGNAGVYVDESADLDYATEKCQVAAFAYSGQVCISVQRILVHKKVYNEFKSEFFKKVANTICGNPAEQKTQVGPIIDKKNIERIQNWLQEARDSGAIVTGGEIIDRNIIKPAIIEKAGKDLNISCVEAFGPIVTIAPVSDIEKAFSILNDSVYGLQAGLFTKNIQHALAAFEELDVGGVVINETPMFRVDNMPYGGIKDSGLGREGVRYTIEEMTERKICILKRDS